jgi:hypothetical protein
MAMSAQAGVQPSGVVEISRAIVSAAADLVGSLERAMIGEAKIRTARGNAWDAMCEDRARSRARDEMHQLVRALMANDPQSFSSPVEPTQPAAVTRPAPAQMASASSR